MSLFPELLVRTVARPDGGLTTVVLRRRRLAARPHAPVTCRRPAAAVTREEPTGAEPVPRESVVGAGGFSRPVLRALAALGDRVRPMPDGVLLDGRRAPLIRVVVEANRRLASTGRPAIAYPGVRAKEGR